MNHKLLPKYLLIALSKLYGLGVTFRNRLFDWKILKQNEFDIPIVVIGNLAVGGTGKTPHTEYIITELRYQYNLAVISRGYKRETKGFLLATNHSTPKDIGDEPYQIYNKFLGEIPVAVCEDRCHGIREVRRLNPDINLILLDDAFQHRYVKPTVAILLTEFSRPLFYDHLLPYGRLREPIEGLNRADIVVVTKCPEQIKPMESRIFINNLKTFPYQHISFSRYTYGQLVPLFPEKSYNIPFLDWLDCNDVILAVSGIGNPRPFVKYLKSFQFTLKITTFPDHHNFTRKDIDIILKRFNSLDAQSKYIVTTEKDAVRLMNNRYFPCELMPYIYYLPIAVEFEETPKELPFIDAIKKCIEKANNNN